MAIKQWLGIEIVIFSILLGLYYNNKKLFSKTLSQKVCSQIIFAKSFGAGVNGF